MIGDLKEDSRLMEVKFHDTIDDSLHKFAVIISISRGKWVFCKHKDGTYDSNVIMVKRLEV